jgi:hypothetical protein
LAKFEGLRNLQAQELTAFRQGEWSHTN